VVGRPARIAVAAPNWLGDAVMSLPAVALAAAAGATLSVLCRSYVSRVYLGLPGIDELWVDADASRAARAWSRARALRAYGCDTAVILPPSFSSALPAFLAGTRRRVGFAGDGRAWMLTDAPALPGRERHLADTYRDLVARALPATGLAVPSGVETPRLRATDRERRAIRERLAGRGLPDGPYALVVPGAAFGPAKSWPWERYRDLSIRLCADVPVVVAGSAGDRETCARVAEGIPGAVNVAGETPAGEFFALVEGARALVANDSGAPHLAAAMGTPVVVLFGSTSPAWTAPRGHRVEVLRHPVHCSPCFRRTCPTQLECFHGIEVDAVLAATRRALTGGPEKEILGRA
jgi:heptosyltransferase-2